MSTSYPSLRASVRSLENDLSSQLAQFSQYAAKLSSAYAATASIDQADADECKRLEGVVERTLDQLLDQIHAMQDLFTREDFKATAAMRHTLTRHEEILADYTKDFRRTQNSLSESSSRASLLNSVRSEISNFKASSPSNDQDPNAAYLAERDHIDSSHRMTDDLLGHAYETRYEFQRQKDILVHAKNRMNGIIATIPGIDSVMNMIRTRRRRDNIILGSLIAFCVLFLLWYISR